MQQRNAKEHERKLQTEVLGKKKLREEANTDERRRKVFTYAGKRDRRVGVYGQHVKKKNERKRRSFRDKISF